MDDCVQSDVWAFGIATALKEGVCHGLRRSRRVLRRFMVAWRREKEVDAARHRQEKREATRLGELLSYTEA